MFYVVIQHNNNNNIIIIIYACSFVLVDTKEKYRNNFNQVITLPNTSYLYVLLVPFGIINGKNGEICVNHEKGPLNVNGL